MRNSSEIPKTEIMEQSLKKTYTYVLLGMLTLIGLYLSSLYNYLLFHSIAELFSIIIACGVFMIAWNSRRFIRNNYLLFIGVSYLFGGPRSCSYAELQGHGDLQRI
jgi:hypothetical protein